MHARGSRYWRKTATYSFGNARFAKQKRERETENRRKRATGSSGKATEEVGVGGRRGGSNSLPASHRFCVLIILETKLTMAVAGCSGSSSAKR